MVRHMIALAGLSPVLVTQAESEPHSPAPFPRQRRVLLVPLWQHVQPHCLLIQLNPIDPAVEFVDEIVDLGPNGAGVEPRLTGATHAG
jgi:hypothetical protein